MQNGIEIEKQASSQLMTICLTSNDPKFDEIYLSNFATLNVLDLLRRIPGVGRVSNIGSRYYAMQIWVDPARCAASPAWAVCPTSVAVTMPCRSGWIPPVWPTTD